MIYTIDAENLQITNELGEPVLVLNIHLIAKQGILPDDIDILLSLHKDRLELLDTMREAEVEDLAALALCRDEHERLQFSLQIAWGFEPNADHHPWYDLPHCACPKLDNYDVRGLKYGYINQDCPLHGVNKAW